MKVPLVIAGVVIVTLVSLLIARSLAPGDTYPPDRYEVLSEGFYDEGLELIARLPEEVSFHCPGANYEIHGREIRFSLLRVRTGREVRADVPVSPRPDGSVALFFPFDGLDPAQGVALVDTGGKSYGTWRSSE